MLTHLIELEEFQVVYARKRTRFFAILIDYLIWLGTFALIGYYFGERYTTEQGTPGFHVEGLPGLACIFSWFIILPVLEGLSGQTIGKKLLGIKVLRQDGDKATMSNTIIRHLFDMVDYLPFLGIIGFVVASRNPMHQRIGDIVGKTIVVKK